MIKLPDGDVPLYVVPNKSKHGATGSSPIFLKHVATPVNYIKGTKPEAVQLTTICYKLEQYRKGDDEIQLYVLDGCQEAVYQIIKGLNDGG